MLNVSQSQLVIGASLDVGAWNFVLSCCAAFHHSISPPGLSDKPRQQNQTDADLTAFGFREISHQHERRVAPGSAKCKQQNWHYHKSDLATSFGRSVDDFSRRILLLLRDPEPPPYLHSPLAHHRGHWSGPRRLRLE